MEKTDRLELERGWFDHDGYACMVKPDAQKLMVDYVMIKNMCGDGP